MHLFLVAKFSKVGLLKICSHPAALGVPLQLLALQLRRGRWLWSFESRCGCGAKLSKTQAAHCHVPER